MSSVSALRQPSASSITIRSPGGRSFFIGETSFVLALVLVVGTVRFGARRWFDLGFFSLQPSEFAKLALFSLKPTSSAGRRKKSGRQQSSGQSIGLMILPFLLIMKELTSAPHSCCCRPDLPFMFAAGTPRRYWCGSVAVLEFSPHCF